MKGKQFHWLEIVEFLSLGLGVISLGVAIASGKVLGVLVFVTLGLLANTLNRLRGQYRQRKALMLIKQQLHRQFSQRLQDLTLSSSLSSSDAPSPSQETDSRAIARLKENLVSLEQSVNTVVRYLNSEVLPERIERLEKADKRLSEDIKKIIEQLDIAVDEAAPDPIAEDPSPPPQPLSPTLDLPQPTTPLPIVSPATEVVSAISIPEWHCLYTFTDHTDAVSSLSLSRDGRWLVSGSWDQTLRLWDLSTGTLKSKVTAHSQGLLAVLFIQSEGKGYEIATGSFDQTIKLWVVEPEDSQTMALDLRETLTHHTGSVHSLGVFAASSLLVSGSYDQTVKQWKLPSGEMACSSYDPLGAIYAIAVDTSQGVIASAGGDGRVTLWQLESGEQIGFLAGNVSSVESLAISPDGQTLAAGCVDGTIKIWQLDASRFGSGRPLQPVRVLKAHSGQVKALLFSQQDQILFSGGADGHLKIWHPSRREAIATLTMNDASQGRRHPAILSLAFDEQRQLLIAGSADGVIKVWQKVMSD